MEWVAAKLCAACRLPIQALPEFPNKAVCRMRAIIVTLLLCLSVPTCAGQLVDISLAEQIDMGMGSAITNHSSFENTPDGGCVQKLLTTDNGGGGWYSGPDIDFVKAGYGPYVDMSGPGTVIEYTARYYQSYGYSDAPIFVDIHDAGGRTRSLGISYGPQPSPTYPAWITCTDDPTLAEGGDPDFDLSRVTSITFYGTDWSGTGSDFLEIRNLRVSDSSVHSPISIAAAKGTAAGIPIEIEGVVSASFPSRSMFYVQNQQRICGIQVRHATSPSAGTKVYVSGTVWNDGDTGESYIDASCWSRCGLGTVRALTMNSRSLGGGVMGREGTVEGGNGLNNIGLFTMIAGRVTGCASDSSYAYVSDGAIVNDGGQYAGVRVDLSSIPFWQRPALRADDMAVVRGVISTYIGEDQERHALIRIADASGLRDIESDGNEPKNIRALVVSFDPYCPGHGDLRTHEVFGWNDPRNLVSGYVYDLMSCSGGWCRYSITDWYDADYHPFFEDGFQYAPDDYVTAWQTHDDENPLHPGTSDYFRLISDKSYPHNQPLSIAERIAGDMIDEVFFFGAPAGFAGWEAAMAGPSPFFINGGTYYVPAAGRNFPLMGFNYERDVDCMLEDFCHRTECTMSRVYQSPDTWLPAWPAPNHWDAFRMFDQISEGNAACGICHYAPNSTGDYDWGNETYVWSTCDDWLNNWPNLLGDITKRFVNCEEWGGGDMRLHHVWWLNHLPKAPGVNPDGKQNNWWKYVCDFNSYPESR